MKKNFLKKLFAGALAATLAFGCLAGCGGDANNAGGGDANGGAQSEAPAGDAGDDGGKSEAPAGDEKDAGSASAEGGTIMWLSNLSSGPGYDAAMSLGNLVCGKLGYKFQVVYGDMFNDPAGNLKAVKDAMTADVKGLIVSQDGGLMSIMEEYPDLYVCGYNTDLGSVYMPSEMADQSAVLDSDKFLGCICDGYSHGEDGGKAYFDIIVDKGYKKVAQIIFPAYAYPQATVGANTFIELAEEYNATAADEDKIEIVGEIKVLEFQPLETSWFMEGENGDLDCVVGELAGQQFVYPAMKEAMASGICSPDTKLVTGGFEKDEAMIADFGNDGVVQALTFSPSENMIFPFVLIDNALNGKQYADLDTAIVDSARYLIDSAEDMENVVAKSLIGTGDAANMSISWEEIEQLLTRNNPDATFKDLVDKLHSDQVLVDALAK